MKKKLFLALLTTLLLLLAATTALAESPSDFNCFKCGEPCTEWYPVISNDGTTPCHAPLCRTCWAIVWDATTPCTPVKGTATCIKADLCSVCGSPDDINSAPNPNAHNMSGWVYASSTRHYRYCQNCYAEDTYEYEDHYGGTATCRKMAVCEGCGSGYGERSNEHVMSKWEGCSATQHVKYCTLCGVPESFIYEDHYGGTATCRNLAICEGCGESYGELSDEHPNMSEWRYLDGTQHKRHCLDCGYGFEYEDHYGGTATCRKMAVCEGCNIIYGELSTEHPWSDWYWVSEEMHMRECPDCGASETADHQSDNGSCLPTCLDCEQRYLDPNGEHRNMQSWYYTDTETHTRLCLDCGAYSETAPHTGGDGSCYPVCEVCYDEYPNPDGKHSLTDWMAITGEQHMRYCDRCGGEDTFEYGDHNGGAATCSDWAICDDCGLSYGDFARDVHLHMSEWKPRSDGHERFCLDCRLPTSFERAPHTGDGTCKSACVDCGSEYYDFDGEHHLTDWIPENNTQHFRYCDRCYGESTHEYADHVGDGTCTPVCEGCGEPYIPLNGTHQWGEWTPNADGTHTRVCALNSEHTETADCTFGDWALADDQYHLRACTDCGAEETGEHTGGTATCSSPRICDVCSEGYGSPDNSGLTGHPNPTIEVKPGTCYDEGYYRVTCNEPGCAMPFYEIATPANGQHIYNNWQPLGDGSHIAACHYCGEELTVPCTVFTAELFAACPICGEYEGGVLPVVYAHDDDESLPYGTLVIRGGEAPVDGVLYAITVAGSYGGNVVELIAPVTVSVPVNATGFRVVDMNGEEIPFTLENGVLTFETAAAGLFLLVPAE